MSGALSLSGLVKRFGDEVAVDGIDLEIGEGEFFSLLGSSGCGKTTTLRMIAGFEQPDAGSIHLDGQDLSSVAPHKRPVNTVFQSYALFPFLSVSDNVAFGLKYQSATPADVRRRVDAALDLVQMGKLAKRKPHQLSGGQQQRVALARALVLEPTVLLLDEPMGALDAKLRKQLQLELRSLQRLVGTTFVYVTHDQDEALTMSDRLAVLHEGHVMQVGTPSEVYSQPANTHVATFLGTTNLYDATVTAVGPERVTCTAGGSVLQVDVGSHPAAVGEALSLMVRPERVEVSPTALETGTDTNLLTGSVTTLTFRGAHTAVLVDIGQLTLEAEVANVHGEPPPWLTVGSPVCVRVSPSALRLLPTG
ncbi:ABC transporter ATP-binding protein [Nocardioides sp.]|uniref:ABC transporter ATP-binding protein n=1 Tax=Nocardioides sp. TaxID=35761 RepID=UPI003D0F9612